MARKQQEEAALMGRNAMLVANDQRRATGGDAASLAYRQRLAEQARRAQNAPIQFAPTMEAQYQQSRVNEAQSMRALPGDAAVPLPSGIEPESEWPGIPYALPSDQSITPANDVENSLTRTVSRLDAIMAASGQQPQSGVAQSMMTPPSGAYIPTWQRNLAMHGVNENQRVGAQNAINAGIALPRMPPTMGTQPMSPGRVDVDMTGNNGLRVRQMQIPQQYGGGVGQAKFPDTDQFNFGS